MNDIILTRRHFATDCQLNVSRLYGRVAGICILRDDVTVFIARSYSDWCKCFETETVCMQCYLEAHNSICATFFFLLCDMYIVFLIPFIGTLERWILSDSFSSTCCCWCGGGGGGVGVNRFLICVRVSGQSLFRLWFNRRNYTFTV